MSKILIIEDDDSLNRGISLKLTTSVDKINDRAVSIIRIFRSCTNVGFKHTLNTE